MSARLRGIAPLGLAVAVVAFLWTEFTLNFSFHWFTVSDGVFGKFGLPESFQLVLPASFVTWGLFFALGADGGALRKTLVAATTGTVAAAAIMLIGPALADSPHFWGVALAVGIAAAGLILVSTAVEGDSLSPAPAFACAGAVLLWWFATGLDNFVPGGKGPHTVEALSAALTKQPLSAGTGAFGGLLSTPWIWVVVSVWASLVCGALLGLVSARLAAFTARAKAPAAVPAEARA